MDPDHVPVSDVSQHGSGEPTGRVRRRRSRSDRARADLRAGLLQLSQAAMRLQADIANHVSIHDSVGLDLGGRLGGCEQEFGTTNAQHPKTPVG